MKPRDWKYIQQALKTNSKCRFGPSISTLGAMVYLELPQHPDSDKNGFWEVLALPSPTFFEKCPSADLLYEGKVIRGYVEFFRLACKMRVRWPDGTVTPVFRRAAIEAILPEVFRPTFNWARYKRDLKEAKAADAESRLTADQKMQREIKKIMRPIPGNGMPVGWERKVQYSMPT